MSRFLITYHGSGMPDPAQMEQAKAAFGAWLASVGPAVVDPGGPVHAGPRVSSGSPTDEVEIGGYSIVEAADADAAVALLRSHPYVARGGTLQVNPVIAV